MVGAKLQVLLLPPLPITGIRTRLLYSNGLAVVGLAVCCADQEPCQDHHTSPIASSRPFEVVHQGFLDLRTLAVFLTCINKTVLLLTKLLIHDRLSPAAPQGSREDTAAGFPPPLDPPPLCRFHTWPCASSRVVLQHQLRQLLVLRLLRLRILVPDGNRPMDSCQPNWTLGLGWLSACINPRRRRA